MQCHPITRDEGDEFSEGEALAWAHPALETDVAKMLMKPMVGNDNRSPWAWLRLRDGTLILGTFPQGDTYFEFSDADVAPFGEKP